jgi:hypothetical protein
MIESPIHYIISEIRDKYSNKDVSILDIRRLEFNYKICSIMSIRNNDSVVIRLTSFGFNGVNFEDFSIDISKLNLSSLNLDNLFEINRISYNLIYGVKLVNENTYLLKFEKNNEISFNDIESRVIEIENKLKKIENNQGNYTLF